jgi:dTDP-4-dehydro-6-deoxy-alpha-D-glucopyranose 2,3-dehydratase
VKRPQWLEDWFSSLIQAADLKMEAIPLSASSEWFLSEGAIRHRSGRFFKIVGVRWKDSDGQTLEQPLIDQPETGVIGLLLRQAEKSPQILVYAKIEPGNVGSAQISPTCQATASNIARVHGGDLPPYSEYFIKDDMENTLCSSLQSEQGTRFLKKRNRNAITSVTLPVLVRDTHRWLAVDELLELLKWDYTVNTDFRSVLACSPWESLVARTPFTRYSTPFARDLACSAAQTRTCIGIDAVRSSLNKLRSSLSAPEVVPLNILKGWSLTAEGVSPDSGGPFVVRQIRVSGHGREVSGWDQPIIDSSGDGRCDLVCGRRAGTLFFLFRPQIEMGLYNLVELGPSVNVEPGQASSEDILLSRAGAEVVAECRQSDEGARFYRDSTVFRIIDVGEVYDTGENGFWLSLRQLRSLLAEDGWFTNEGRSVLSLLLAWL